MREIKFRAWIKTTKKWQSQENVDFCPIRELRGAGNVDDYIWMQFTGLYDKNGKEIYDGDIVRRIYRQWCCGKENYRMEGVVEWFGEGWSIKEDDGNYTGWANQKNEDIEVIGNIYENPELLPKEA